MDIMNHIDLLEYKVIDEFPGVLEILLLDRTTNENILWGSDNYLDLSSSYLPESPMTLKAITEHRKLIQPRNLKPKHIQKKRMVTKGEVFTPAWLCNVQNNKLDQNWIDSSGPFNKECEKSWQTNNNAVIFYKGKSWQNYVKDLRLEVCCGEAPYLVSRYDALSGKAIELKNRIGILDRKLRIINENCSSNLWFKYALEAYKACYAYEIQGDNLLLARENMFITFLDYYMDRFQVQPSLDKCIEIATIISWNLWQMDGLRFVVPFSCKHTKKVQTIFGEKTSKEVCVGCAKHIPSLHNGVYCQIMDWEKNDTITFLSLYTNSTNINEVL
ncbi:MAG: hypothetical protein MJ189_00025 [Coriobacteriales bacterium]|nr:hypothetical protein [Coriobacteriales bacterium]